MLNDDQKEWLRYLASLPRDKICPCGWYTREECDRRPRTGSCVENRAKAGLPPHQAQPGRTP